MQKQYFFSFYLCSHIIGNFVEIKEISRQHMCFCWVMSHGPSKSGQLPITSRTDMTANVEDCSIQSPAWSCGREMECSSGDSCLCKGVPEDVACGLSSGLHPSPPHPAPSGESMMVMLPPQIQQTTRFRLGLINTL